MYNLFSLPVPARSTLCGGKSSLTMSSRKRKDAKKKPQNLEVRETDDSNEKKVPYREVRTSTDPSVYKKAVNRALVRVAFIAAFLIGLMFIRGKEDVKVLAAQSETIDRKIYQRSCSNDYDNYKRIPGCTPVRCGRVVMDDIITKEEAKKLLQIAKKGLAFGGSSGGASILDLHSGALSKGNSFINLYKYLDQKNFGPIFSAEDAEVYTNVKNKIRKAISREFGIKASRLHLTHPTFFSRLTSAPATTVHDEYWHPHIDKVTYETFDYTSLVYLTDYGKDFNGGRFVFVDKEANWTVEPKLGRLSFFTSGSENLHYVEKVSSGTRYAITVSFSCDEDNAISDPDFSN
ncbi:2-oxoglutarate and iron-dependent oxygenase domain-containing protein 3-like [Ptychodera flava]|uniref:2-oxoglutarate and iron-dependent oxygenase domain-containing protein 3-like n=1 Tax=Ptychodera flava TaxID=63121 RepID=UPI00396AA57C